MDKLSELEVPFGVTAGGRLVKASEAIIDESYACPACRAPLVLRRGEIRVAHFAHSSESSCAQESVLHKTAKRLLVQTILDQGQIIQIENQCARCGDAFAEAVPASVRASAIEEAPLDKFVVDVLMAGANRQLAIEVLVTHEVGVEKAELLPIPWIELTAESIIENAAEWRPLKRGKTRARACPACAREIDNLRRLAVRWKIALPDGADVWDLGKSGYAAACTSCWHCRQDILVFWWDGVPFCQQEPPPSRPRTIQRRYSKQYGGKYWANCCPGCNMVQGDNFVFLDLKGEQLFPGLPVAGENNTGAIREMSAREASDFLVSRIFPDFEDG